MNHLPLEGVRIIDLGRFISAPFSAMLLGDLGAEVIKVEKPGGNNDRLLGPFNKNGESMYASIFNRNKKHVTIDTRSEKGKDLLRQLICHSDVVIDNYRPGVMKKMGFDYESVKKYKPDIIMASISGFGQNGPDAKRAAFDGIATATAGVMYFNNLPGYGPRGLGTPVADICSGYVNALAIMTALFAREHSGQGQYIDTAMVDCCVPLLETQITAYSLSGIIPDIGTRKGGDPMTAPANTFKVKDGYFYMHAGTDSLFKIFAELTGDPELLSEPYQDLQYRVKHADRTEELAGKWLINYTAEEAEKIMIDAGIPCAIINTIDRVINSDSAKERKRVVTIDMPGTGPVTYLGNPIHLSNTPLEHFQPGEKAGQSNETVFKGLLGLNEETIRSLSNEGII